MNLPANPSESVKRRNPHLYPVAGLSNPIREQDRRRQGEDRQLDKSKEGVCYCVTIISIRSRLVDQHDNLRTGCKPLVDLITNYLGFANDDNPRLLWRYGQVLSQTKGTVVVIERL